MKISSVSTHNDLNENKVLTGDARLEFLRNSPEMRERLKCVSIERAGQ